MAVKLVGILSAALLTNLTSVKIVSFENKQKRAVYLTKLVKRSVTNAI